MGAPLAVILGAGLYALSFPPFDEAACAWIALVPLLLAVRDRTPRSAFMFGLLYGVACAWALGPWMAPALGRFFQVGLPVGVVAASAYAVLFWGSAFGLFAAGNVLLQRGASPASNQIVVPALWVGVELFRARVLQQPWGLLGYSQYRHPGMVQIAALTGVYGVSFLLASGSVAVANAWSLWRTSRSPACLLALSIPAMLFVAVWTGGTLFALGGPIGGFSAGTVAIVQTNVPPMLEWTRAYTDRQVLAHVQATEAALAPKHAALVVWPEHAIPRYLESEPMLAAELSELAVRHRTDLLFGAPRYDDGRVFNSVRLISSRGLDGGEYDKQRLVFLAEAKPFTTSGAPSDSPQEFSAGSTPGVLQGFWRLGVSICHEILFSDVINSSVEHGADVLVNVSNDGWLDGGSGVASRQHFAMAVFRAVETRRYLVRAATTGVSGVVDPYGRIIDSLPPNTSGVVTTSVAGRTGLTPYVRFGDAFAFSCIAAAAAALLSRRTIHFSHPRRIAVPAPRTP